MIRSRSGARNEDRLPTVSEVVRSFRQLRSTERNDQGFTVLATLSVVLTLGLLATMVMVASPGSSPQGDQTSTPNVATTIPRSIARGASESAISACEIDFQAVNAAVATYRALNGSSPPEGTAWAMSTTNGGPFLQTWPSNVKYFSLAWNGTALDVIPARGILSHGTFGTSSPATGCYAA